MMTESEQALQEADNPKEKITVADFSVREGLTALEQKRLLGKLVNRTDRKLDDPILAYDDPPTDEQLKDPGSLLMLDDWRAKRWAESIRQSHKS